MRTSPLSLVCSVACAAHLPVAAALKISVATALMLCLVAQAVNAAATEATS